MSRGKRHFFLLFSLLVGATLCFPQISYYPYYGKNKVLYETFDWKVYKTEHFDIYYYTDNIKDLERIADLAESAYQSISEDIKHRQISIKPISSNSLKE
jgi:hypothetical protein